MALKFIRKIPSNLGLFPMAFNAVCILFAGIFLSNSCTVRGATLLEYGVSPVYAFVTFRGVISRVCAQKIAKVLKEPSFASVMRIALLRDSMLFSRKMLWWFVNFWVMMFSLQGWTIRGSPSLWSS